MSEQQWEPETIAEAVARYREARAVYRTLAAQQERLYSELQRAEQDLRKATHLYGRCLRENATIPEHARRTEALIAENSMVSQ